MITIGIIGGSGLDDPNILCNIQVKEVDTKFGKPSSSLQIGKIGNNKVVLLSRHGKEHTIPPTQVNNRANILALKNEGCDYIIATTAVGSLKAEIRRGDFIILDQFIDFTRHRFFSFYESFEPNNAKHTPMANPFSVKLNNIIIQECENLKIPHHPKGTVITIEGPRFSTKAESKMFKLWGADVINMSIAPEVALANEAGIPYCAIAMSTDYDCWKDDEKPVSWEEILKIFKQNSNKMKELLLSVIKNI